MQNIRGCYILGLLLLDQSNTTISDFGTCLISVNYMHGKYPACKYPQSLLRKPKDVIKKALVDVLTDTDKELLRISLGTLDFFVDDTVVNEINAKILAIPEIATELKRQQLID